MITMSVNNAITLYKEIGLYMSSLQIWPISQYRHSNFFFIFFHPDTVEAQRMLSTRIYITRILSDPSRTMKVFFYESYTFWTSVIGRCHQYIFNDL